MSEADGVNDTAPWDPDRAYFKLNLKGHPGYEATLVNIGAGTIGEFRRAVCGFFGFEVNEDESPMELALRATELWHARNSINMVFGDVRPVGGNRGRGNARDRAYQAAREEGQQEAPDPKDVLLAQIEAQDSVTALKRLYGENKAAFEAKGEDDQPTPAAVELVAAYKAKGKALSAKANQ